MKLMYGIVNLCWGFARVLHISNNSFCRKLMKTCIIALIVVVANIMACFASDPGGMPGLVQATFKGSSFDSTSDVVSHAQGCVVCPEEMYATSLPEKTTVAWAGYMKMEGGVTYEFTGCYDDFVTVKIAGTSTMH